MTHYFTKASKMFNKIKQAFRCRFCNETPYGDALLIIRKFRVYHRKLRPDPKDPLLYLSLDVEWRNTVYFQQMLDVLKEKKVCAFMFLQGDGMRDNVELVRRIEAEGHCVGNHTMNHPNLTQCSQEEVLSELEACHDLYVRLTGHDMSKIIRPPYGRIHRPLARFLCRNGYTMMHWSLHVPDFGEKQPERNDYETYLKERLHNGGVILQHSFSSGTAENLGYVIDLCRQEGYRFAEKKDFAEFLRKG